MRTDKHMPGRAALVIGSVLLALLLMTACNTANAATKVRSVPKHCINVVDSRVWHTSQDGNTVLSYNTYYHKTRVPC